MSSGERPRALSGQKFMVTGGTRDIGGAITESLVAEGAEVIAGYREKSKPAQALENRLSGRMVAVQSDISQLAGRDKLLEACGEQLHGLILNASGPADKLNVTGNLDLVERTLPLLQASGQGIIILMQSLPAQFYPWLKDQIPDIYKSVAKSKFLGGVMINALIDPARSRADNPQYYVVCPPLVPDTSNIRLYFQRLAPDFVTFHHQLTEWYGLPKEVSIRQVGVKVRDLIVKRDYPNGHIEFFKG
jgi:hypothetical protein